MDASTHLLQHLNEAATSLTRFRDIAFKDTAFSSDFTTGAASSPPGSSSNVSSTYTVPRSLPSPSSSHGISPSIPQPSIALNSAEGFDAKARAVSYSSSPSSLPFDPSSRRASTSSEIQQGSIGMPSCSASGSNSGPPRQDPLPPLHPHLHPRDISPLVPPHTIQPARRDMATPVHQFTLPPLRLPSPEDRTHPRHGSSSHTTPHARHHPYSQSYDSFPSTHLTPSTWSDLPRAGPSHSQSHSSLPNRSEDSEDDFEDDEGDDDDMSLTYMDSQSQRGRHIDFAMRDDTVEGRQGRLPHSSPPMAPPPSYHPTPSVVSSRPNARHDLAGGNDDGS